MFKNSKKLALFKDKFIEETERTRIQFLCVYIIFSVLSLFMTVLNIFTHYTYLTYITATFGVLSLINVAITMLKNELLDTLTRGAFSIEIIALFTAFIIIGEPMGFSALWSAMLPLAGLFLFKRKRGTILSGAMLLIIVFLFWTGLGQSLLQKPDVYSDAFMQRFPVLYLAFYVVGFLFEYIIEITQKELEDAKDKYYKMSITDKLTGLGSETAYISLVTRIEQEMLKKHTDFSIAVMDVNNVKAVNDTFGHRYGCNMIVTAGKILPLIFTDCDIFHVGGDEFVAIITGDNCKNIDLYKEVFSKELEYKKITFNGEELTLSVALGFANHKEDESYSETFERADKDMYKNKKALKVKYNLSDR